MPASYINVVHRDLAQDFLRQQLLYSPTNMYLLRQLNLDFPVLVLSRDKRRQVCLIVLQSCRVHCNFIGVAEQGRDLL